MLYALSSLSGDIFDFSSERNSVFGMTRITLTSILIASPCEPIKCQKTPLLANHEACEKQYVFREKRNKKWDENKMKNVKRVAQISKGTILAWQSY